MVEVLDAPERTDWRTGFRHVSVPTLAFNEDALMEDQEIIDLAHDAAVALGYSRDIVVTVSRSSKYTFVNFSLSLTTHAIFNHDQLAGRPTAKTFNKPLSKALLDLRHLIVEDLVPRLAST